MGREEGKVKGFPVNKYRVGYKEGSPKASVVAENPGGDRQGVGG